MHKNYECENLFDTEILNYWGSHDTNDWVRINFKEEYYIKSVNISPSSTPLHPKDRPKNVSLEFSNGKEFKTQLQHDIKDWDEIVLPPNIISNYLNLSVKSLHDNTNWFGLNEIVVLGCRKGINTLVLYSVPKLNNL